eukprot:6485761-Pyramimonas_sp.AAC.1
MGAILQESGAQLAESDGQVALDGVPLGEAGAVALADSMVQWQASGQVVKTLQLNGAQLSDKGAAAIALACEQLPALEELHLCGNGLGGEDTAKAIAHMLEMG